MAQTEQANKLFQIIELAREKLRKDKVWNAEFSTTESVDLVRAILAATPGVTNPGNVTMTITGGENGLDKVVGAVKIAGLEAKKLFVKIKIDSVQLELRNLAANMPTGQDRLEVMRNIVANPATVAGQNVSAVLHENVGGGKINEMLAKEVFAKKLATGPNPVTVKTYGVGLTANNTLKISLTA